MENLGIPYKPYIISFKIVNRSRKNQNTEDLYQVLTIGETPCTAIKTAESFIKADLLERSKADNLIAIFQECRLFKDADRIRTQGVFRIIL